MDLPSPGLMAAGQPSRSALMVAMLRAIHQVQDSPRVLDDPLALAILGPRYGEQMQQQLQHAGTGFARLLRAAMVVRSRLAEDTLAQAILAGVRQYVVLGAGLDTYAYRHSEPALQVYEVDHPATQDWKRTLLNEAGIALPPSLRLVPVDFERTSLAHELRHAGLCCDLPAVFSWLGVTLYLSRDAIFDTLKFVAGMPRGSSIVFDYGVDPDLLNPAERMGVMHFAKKYAEQGEPWKSFFTPAALEQDLLQAGFSQVRDLDAAELQARYLAQRQDGLRLGGGTRLMLATV